MSEFTVEKLSCRQCGTPVEVTLWNSVNVTSNPELKEKVLSGDIFLAHCPNCGVEMTLLHELLYHDMEKRHMIWLTRPGEDGRPVIDMDEADKLTQVMAGYRLRVVASFNQLLEKIYIFESSLDDRVVELLKASLWAQGACNTHLERDSLLFSHLEKDETGQPQAIILVQFTPDGESQGFSAPWEIGYQQAQGFLYGNLGVPAGDLPRWQIVDAQYIEVLDKNA